MRKGECAVIETSFIVTVFEAIDAIMPKKDVVRVRATKLSG